MCYLQLSSATQQAKEATLGALASGVSGAPSPVVVSCSGDAGGGGSVTTGIKNTTGILVAGVIGGAGQSIQVTLAPPSVTDASPYAVVISVAAWSETGQDGTFEQEAKGLQCKNDAGAGACELIGGGFSTNIIPDASGAGFTVFCPYPSGAAPGASVDYVFDISVTGPGNVSFTPI